MMKIEREKKFISETMNREKEKMHKSPNYGQG